MTNKNKHVLSQIRQVARRTAPKGSVVLLFGSRARGEARKSSDWDILIILPKDQLQQADYDQVSYPLVELGGKLANRLTLLCTLNRNGKPTALRLSMTMFSAMPLIYFKLMDSFGSLVEEPTP